MESNVNKPCMHMYTCYEFEMCIHVHAHVVVIKLLLLV